MSLRALQTRSDRKKQKKNIIKCIIKCVKGVVQAQTADYNRIWSALFLFPGICAAVKTRKPAALRRHDY